MATTVKMEAQEVVELIQVDTLHPIAPSCHSKNFHRSLISRILFEINIAKSIEINLKQCFFFIKKRFSGSAPL